MHKHKYDKKESKEHEGKKANPNSAYTEECALNKLLLFREEFMKL